MNKLFCFLLCAVAYAETPASMVVTVETHHIDTAPALQPGDIQIYEGKNRARVTDVTHLNADALQLWVLIDDGSDPDLGIQLPDIKKFLAGLPPTAQAGVGYLRNGTVAVTQALTSDHAAVANAIRLPLGQPGISASPYTALSDLIHQWPQSGTTREVLMITSGLDSLAGPPPDNPYLQKAIHDAQRAGVVVYSIYFGAHGHWGHNAWMLNWGQNFLSQLSSETGGEAYWQGFSNPVSFSPYLDDLTKKLANQYLVQFESKMAPKAEYTSVKVRTELPHVDLIAPDHVWIGKR